jgi:serine/threonine-protein kinase
MGRVYAATQTNLDRRVAIKLATTERAELRDRFLLEAKTLARVNHRNVVTVHDCGEADDGELFLVMELLEGRTLSQVMRAAPGERLALADVRSCAAQLARGLRAVHRVGVVHRDVKPSNVFVVPGGDESGAVYKIFDFGIVKAEDAYARTAAGFVIGTPAYMAPEQITGGAVDARTDLYALGVLLYEALCGVKPFPLRGAPALFRAHLEHTPGSPCVHRAEVPEALARIVLRLLEKRPRDRFSSCDELLRALDEERASAAPLPVVAGEASQPVVTEHLPRIESPLTPALGIHMNVLPRAARIIESPFSTETSERTVDPSAALDATLPPRTLGLGEPLSLSAFDDAVASPAAGTRAEGEARTIAHVARWPGQAALLFVLFALFALVALALVVVR